MPSVLFLQNIYFQNLGPMYISSVLKREGIKVAMHSTHKLQSVKLDGIDIVAFSCTTGSHILALEWARQIKSMRKYIFIIMGGAHPTFFPEVLSEDSPLDAICRGEGESAMKELCLNLHDREKVSRIPGLFVKTENGIKANKMGPPSQDLDALPFPDRDLYGTDFHGDIQPVLSSRGCAYDCTFCFNNSFRKLVKEETHQSYCVRYRSPENILEELQSIKKISSLIQFRDESFTTNKNRLKVLLTMYAQRIKLPFTCQVRANELDVDTVKLLKEANVHAVFMGVETGSEKLRNALLKKSLKDEEIKRGAALLHQHKIPFRTYNILGLPEETLEDVHSTIRLNQEIKADYPWVSLLMPYRGTEIYEHFKGHYQSDSVNDLEWFFPKSDLYRDKKELLNLHNLFILYVKFPFLKPVLDFLTRLPPNPVYRLIYKITYAWASYKSEGMTLGRFMNHLCKMNSH